MKTLLIGWMAVMAVALSFGENPSWVFNSQLAPMVLEAQPRGAYILKNTSGKKVTSFALGCVLVGKGSVVVKSALPKQIFSIPPGGSFSEAIVDAPYTDAYSECVVKQKARLAFLLVDFEDGSSWTVSPTRVRNII